MNISSRKILLLSTVALGLIAIFALSSHALLADAQPAYVPLAPITSPGVSIRTTDLTSFLVDAVRVAIAASAALAVLMVIFGGLQYMSTDAFTGKSDARKRIEYALIGFLLVMISYLILRTINPALVDFSAISSDLRNGTGINDIQNGSSDQKIIPIGHSGEVGNTPVQEYSFKNSNGTRFNVTGLKSENLNALNDTDFYSISIIKNPMTVYYETEQECLANESQQISSNITQSCQQTTGGPTFYKEVDPNGIVAVSNENQATCNQGISNKTGWTCVAYTPIYALGVGQKDISFSNLTLLACENYQSTWTQNNPRQTTSPCTHSPLQ
jgi:hypothetical protein